MSIGKNDTVRANVWGRDHTGFVLYIMPDGWAMVDFGGVMGKHYIRMDAMTKVEG